MRFQRFSLDTRSLALFRMGLALVILWDLFDRSHFLNLLYTDAGVQFKWDWPLWSLHSLNGSLLWQLFLFISAGLYATLLFVGWQARWMAAVCWFLTLSLQNHNPGLLFGGDVALRMLLFWSIFLPIGGTITEGQTHGRVTHWASAALIAQVAVMFGMSGAFKLTDSLWREGLALQTSLAAHPGVMASWLLSWPKLLVPLNYLVIIIQIGFAFAVFTRARGLAVLVMLGMELTMAVTMDLGYFPFICIVGCLALIPEGFWRARPAWHSVCASKLRLRMAALTAGVLIPGLTQLPFVDGPHQTWTDWVLPVTSQIGFNQDWTLFTPAPRETVQLAFRLTNDDGATRVIESATWSKMHWAPLTGFLFSRPLLRGRLADSICRSADSRLAQVEIVETRRPLLTAGPDESYRLILHSCPGHLDQAMVNRNF